MTMDNPRSKKANALHQNAKNYNDRVAALKRALAPDVEDLIFADGDIIAWRMPEMMTTETVHRTAVYLERRQLWF